MCVCKCVCACICMRASVYVCLSLSLCVCVSPQLLGSCIPRGDMCLCVPGDSPAVQYCVCHHCVVIFIGCQVVQLAACIVENVWYVYHTIN